MEDLRSGHLSGGYRLPCRAGDGQRKFHTERGAAAAPVGDFDRAAMLLNDTVGHRKSQAGAFARALGGEERIVDAVQILRRDAVAGVGDFDARRPVLRAQVRTSSVPPRCHGVARVQEQIQEHLLQLAGVAVTGGQIRIEIGLDWMPAFCNWCSSSDSVS